MAEQAHHTTESDTLGVSTQLSSNSPIQAGHTSVEDEGVKVRTTARKLLSALWNASPIPPENVLANSLYPSLAERVTHRIALRILLSIGPTETAHFQIWHDKAGAAVSPP